MPPGSYFPPQQPEPTVVQLNTPGIRAVMPPTVVVSGIAAVVNGKPITNQDLVISFIKDGGATELNELIIGSLIQQEATKQHVTISHQEIMDKYDDFKKTVLRKAPAGDTWAQVLTMEGRSEDYAMRQVRLRLQLEKLVAATLPKQSLVGQIHIYHILIPTVPLPPDHLKPLSDADALAKIKQIAADIESKKITFQDAAKRYSEDEGTRDKGGDLGWVSKNGRLDPDFEKAAFALKEGQMSDPVKSEYGYHLILLTRTGEHAAKADIDALNKAYQDQEIPARISAYVQGLRDKAVIENLLLPGVALPKAPPPPAMGATPTPRATYVAPPASRTILGGPRPMNMPMPGRPPISMPLPGRQPIGVQPSTPPAPTTPPTNAPTPNPPAPNPPAPTTPR